MKRLAAMAATAFVCLQHAHAGPADYIYLPTVEHGEREIDFKFGSSSKKNVDRESAASLGFGYGVTDYWFTEFYGKYAKTGDAGAQFDAWEWENKFQLTETGEYPVTVGFLTEIERPRNRSEGYELRWGPLFQTEFGKIQLNANLLFERYYQSETPSKMQIGYQFQAKYRWLPQFEYGVQAFGEMGKWNSWDSSNEQNHRVGPAIFGKFPLGGRQVLKYNAAYLIGTTSNSPDRTFRVQAEYEF